MTQFFQFGTCCFPSNLADRSLDLVREVRDPMKTGTPVSASIIRCARLAELVLAAGALVGAFYSIKLRVLVWTLLKSS